MSRTRSSIRASSTTRGLQRGHGSDPAPVENGATPTDADEPAGAGRTSRSTSSRSTNGRSRGAASAPPTGGVRLVLFLTIVVIAIVGPFFIPFNFYELPPPQAHCPGDARVSGRTAARPARASVRDDGRPRARRAHGRRQRRPAVADHRRGRVALLGAHRRDRGRRGGLLRRLAGQHPDARRGRPAQPADPVRHPGGRRSSSAAARGSRSSSCSPPSAGPAWHVSSEVCS